MRLPPLVSQVTPKRPYWQRNHLSFRTPSHLATAVVNFECMPCTYSAQCLQSRRALRAERTHAVRGQERAVRQPGRLNDIAPLGEATQFVVDHAPCPVLLVWPQAVPGIATIPPHARSPATPPPLSRRPGARC